MAHDGGIRAGQGIQRMAVVSRGTLCVTLNSIHLVKHRKVLLLLINNAISIAYGYPYAMA
jgi:hypothetical protein